MNGTLLLTVMRERIQNPGRRTIAGLCVVLPFFHAAFMPPETIGIPAWLWTVAITLALGGGLIGMEVSAGTLHLVFARPITRSSYVLHRWLGLSLDSAGACLLQLGVVAAIATIRHAPVPAGDWATAAGDRLLLAVGLSAVVTFLSALSAGFGDLKNYVLLWALAGIGELLGRRWEWSWMVRAADELAGFLLPRIELAQILAAPPVPWRMIVSYMLTVTLSIALAIVAMNRKELTYASGAGG